MNSHVTLWSAQTRADAALVIDYRTMTAGRRRLSRGDVGVSLVDTGEQVRLRFETHDDGVAFDGAASARIDADAAGALADAVDERTSEEVAVDGARQHVDTEHGTVGWRQAEIGGAVTLSVDGFDDSAIWLVWFEAKNGRAYATLPLDSAPSAVSGFRQAARRGDRQ